jgi:hypothetical protein
MEDEKVTEKVREREEMNGVIQLNRPGKIALFQIIYIVINVAAECISAHN